MIGVGVLKGMLLTLREFIGTYPAGRVLLREGKGYTALASRE